MFLKNYSKTYFEIKKFPFKIFILEEMEEKHVAVY